VTVDSPYHDFGDLVPDMEVTHHYKLANSGDAPLHITRVTSSCGCTSSLAGKNLLEPGETTVVDVTFHTAGISGPASKSVEVMTDDPDQPKLLLTFQAVVGPAIKVDTATVVFQDLGPDDHAHASVKMESGTGKPITVTNMDMSDAPWLGVVTRSDGLDAWVDLDLYSRKLPPGKLAGTDTLTVHLENPKPWKVPLSVHWERRAPVIATPARVAWAEPAGQDLHASVQLKSRANKPFRILSARTSNPMLQVLGISPRAGATQRVQLLLSSAARPGQYDEKAFLTLDTPGHPEFEVRVSASLH
jgi:hypothetical protein